MRVRQGPRAAAPDLNLPPGTYGQRREASGKVLGNRCSATARRRRRPRKFPRERAAGRLITVGSVGSSGLQYRVFAARDPEDTGLTIVAVPLHEVEQTLTACCSSRAW